MIRHVNKPEPYSGELKPFYTEIILLRKAPRSSSISKVKTEGNG
jgi:hypothetical protein